MNRFLLGALLLLALSLPCVAQSTPEWTVVDYSVLVDGRQLSQSGESVSRLIEQLDGRPVPPVGQRPNDRRLHKLLEQLVEPYGFVLSDALDALEAPPDFPLIEVAQLWQPGESQPAWVDLLRSRKFIVESDGAGTLRVILPWVPSANLQDTKSAEAAAEAWDLAWPVLRHVFAAERRRLATSGQAPALNVRAYPYAHSPARSLFLLGKDPHRVAVEDTQPTGDRPPLDLAQLSEFLASGWNLEGGKLDQQGRLTLLGSPDGKPATLLGRKLELSDLAVAFRAVAYGGLGEPAMSLDRSHSPWQSLVSYGGRLSDTSLGWVSLLCDVRFKTFSMGLGIEEGRDLRAEVRAEVPSFKTHIERFAADPASATVSAQQTRLWFYPDRVDLTVAPQGDVLAMRHVRLSAASERLADETFAPGQGSEPDWTKATIGAINEHYDGLARVFPELADLDQVVRLLSFFTWLDQAAPGSGPVPDLDALLAVELPALPTPRTFPQMLSFNALPPAGSAGPVGSFDRVPVVDALGALNPSNGLLDPQVRLQRALAGLDRGVPEEAQFIDEIAATNPAALSPSELDLLAFRAQRLRMHRTVLGAFDPKLREELEKASGDPLRVISVGVGGLDLGMRKVVDRAHSRSIGLLGARAALPGAQRSAYTLADVSAETRALWRQDPPALPRTVMPDHGIGKAGLTRHFGAGWIEITPGVSGDDDDSGGALRIVHGAAGPEVVARGIRFDAEGKPRLLDRLERGRRWSYRLEQDKQGMRAARIDAPAAVALPAAPKSIELPDGLAMLRIDPETDGNPAAASIGLRLQSVAAGPLDAATPRWVVQRLILGHQADLAHDPSLPGIAPLPSMFGEIESLMVLGRASLRQRPWETEPRPIAGEQDPLRVAAAINAWWDAPGALPAPGGAVVGVDWEVSPQRWAQAPRPGAQALLVLPEGGFPLESSGLAKLLAEAWTSGRVSAQADPTDETLVVVVSAEAPGLFASRLRAISKLPAMRGKLLAGWSLAGPVRDDLAPWILEEAALAGVGIAEGSVVSRRSAAQRLQQIVRALTARGESDRVESIPGPFLWHF
jgi:hypothetical protein